MAHTSAPTTTATPRQPSQTTRYDVIIIGSGVGALSTASLMARVHDKRVLVLERHHTLGGLSHTFGRRGYRWDVGLHYVGQMNPGSLERHVMDYLTGGRLGWRRMQEPFERFIYPDLSFDVYGEPESYQGDLEAEFPHQRQALRRYFNDLSRAARWAIWNAAAGSDFGTVRCGVAAATKRWQTLALQTTAEYMCRTFDDPKLRALLTSRWGVCGLPPSRSAFCMHAMLACHYLLGGYYPIGGSARIAETIVPIVEARGGALVTRQEVTRILVSGGRATGVEAKDHRGATHRYEADAVVSNAGALNTYAHLLPHHLGAARAKRFETLARHAPSAVVVYLGLRKDPRDLGIHGENLWINRSYDHDTHRACDRILAGKPQQCFASFPSLRDSGQDRHTAQVMTFVPSKEFSKWRHTRFQRRGPDYDDLKRRMAGGLISLVDGQHPGFADGIDHVEVSTPLTVEHFTASPFGAVYGLPGTPERYRERLISTRTPIENLFLTGADGFVHGIWGAMMGGMATAGALTGRLGFLRLMHTVTRADPWDAASSPPPETRSESGDAPPSTGDSRRAACPSRGQPRWDATSEGDSLRLALEAEPHD